MFCTLRTFLNFTCAKTYSFNGNFVRCMHGYSKEIRKVAAVPTASPDILLQNLKNVTSTSLILNLVSTHHTIMNNKHLIQALRTLFTLQKYGNSDLSTQQILKHPDFEKICQHLKAQAGLIELNDTIDVLKVICYVGVSSDCTIVQVLLQLLRHNINELSLGQIIFLDFLINQLKKTPLVEALQIALPIVFEIQLSTKMDRQNVNRLAEYLQYVSKKNVSDRCIENIVHSLLDCNETIDGKTAYSIIWSICDMKPHEFFEPLVKQAIEALIIDVDNLSYREIETTLSKLLFNYTYKTKFYYNDIFCDICANYVIDNDLGFNHAIYLFKKFTKVTALHILQPDMLFLKFVDCIEPKLWVIYYHTNDNLLNYMSEKAYSDPILILDGNPSNVYTAVLALAMTDYKPKYWDNLKENIEQTSIFESVSKKDIIWLKLASSLCVLDIYKLDVLQKVLQPDYLDHLLKKRFVSDYENLLLVYQAIKTFKPEYSYILPEKEIVNNTFASLKATYEYPLEAALHKALGGEQYVTTKLFTKLGHQIDHLIMFRKGGYPVAFTTSNRNLTFIEDIERFPDSNLVIILGLGENHYDLNTKRIKGSTLLSIRSLEASNYFVVPICLEVWESLQDFEKIPYIMQAIKEKTDNYLLEQKSF